MIFLRESASLSPDFFFENRPNRDQKRHPQKEIIDENDVKCTVLLFSSKKTTTPIIMYKQINQIIGYDFRLFYFITATTTQKSSKFVLKKIHI